MMAGASEDSKILTGIIATENGRGTNNLSNVNSPMATGVTINERTNDGRGYQMTTPGSSLNTEKKSHSTDTNNATTLTTTTTTKSSSSSPRAAPLESKMKMEVGEKTGESQTAFACETTSRSPSQKSHSQSDNVPTLNTRLASSGSSSKISQDERNTGTHTSAIGSDIQLRQQLTREHNPALRSGDTVGLAKPHDSAPRSTTTLETDQREHAPIIQSSPELRSNSQIRGEETKGASNTPTKTTSQLKKATDAQASITEKQEKSGNSVTGTHISKCSNAPRSSSAHPVKGQKSNPEARAVSAENEERKNSPKAISPMATGTADTNGKHPLSEQTFTLSTNETIQSNITTNAPASRTKANREKPENSGNSVADRQTCNHSNAPLSSSAYSVDDQRGNTEEDVARVTKSSTSSNDVNFGKTTEETPMNSVEEVTQDSNNAPAIKTEAGSQDRAAHSTPGRMPGSIDVGSRGQVLTRNIEAGQTSAVEQDANSRSLVPKTDQSGDASTTQPDGRSHSEQDDSASTSTPSRTDQPRQSSNSNTNSELASTRAKGTIATEASNAAAKHKPEADQSQTSKAKAKDGVPKTQIKSIDDITSEDIIDTLSVRQMKDILTKNYVECQSICEKDELVIRMKSLWENVRQSSSSKPEGAEIGNEDLCTICLTAWRNCVFLECGHLICCTECGQRTKECPVCREYIVRIVRILHA